MKCLKCGTELPADHVGTCSKCANECEVNQQQKNNSQNTNEVTSSGSMHGIYLFVVFIVYFVFILMAILSLATIIDVELMWFGDTNPARNAVVNVYIVATLLLTGSLFVIYGMYKRAKWAYYFLLTFSSLIILAPLSALSPYLDEVIVWSEWLALMIGFFVLGTILFLNIKYFGKLKKIFS